MTDHHSTHTGTVDDLLQVLADRHRRELLSYLRESTTEPVSVHELADVLSARTTTDRSAVLAGLHHCHLPSLDDTTVIDYNAEAGSVRYAGHPELEALLDVIEDYAATVRLPGD